MGRGSNTDRPGCNASITRKEGCLGAADPRHAKSSADAFELLLRAVNHLDHGSQAVGGAGGGRADGVLLRQQVVVAAHHHVQDTFLCDTKQQTNL